MYIPYFILRYFIIVTPLVDKKFDILPDILHEPFVVSTPVGEWLLQKGCIEIVQ